MLLAFNPVTGFEILHQAPPSTYLHDVIACDQISQAFLLYIYILQAIKYWR